MNKKSKGNLSKLRAELNSSEERNIEVIKSNFSCAICLSITEDPCMTPCGHLFCSACLMSWIEAHPEPACPNCRNLFDANSVVHISNSFSSRNKNICKDQKKKILKPGFSCQNMKYGNLLICKIDNNKPSLKSIGITCFLGMLLMICAEAVTSNFRIDNIQVKRISKVNSS